MTRTAIECMDGDDADKGGPDHLKKGPVLMDWCIPIDGC
jgi:hypothetical protein